MALFGLFSRSTTAPEIDRLQTQIEELKASAAATVMVTPQDVGRASWTPRKYESLSREGYQNNSTSYRCVNLLAKSGAMVKPVLKRKKSTDIIEDHPLLTLLHRPTPRWGMQAMFEALYAFLMIHGNTYLEAVSPRTNAPPLELWNQRPDRMHVIPGQRGIPLRYEYRNSRGQKIAWPVNQVTGLSDIMHHHEFHPTDDWVGMGRLEAASWAIDRHNAMSEHNTALLQNGARPSGVLVLQPKKNAGGAETFAPKEVVKEAEERLAERNRGPKSAGRPLVMNGNVDWIDMAMNLRDMDFAAGKEDAMLEICNAFGVPYVLLMRGESTYNNLVEAKLELWEQSVIPMVDAIYDRLNTWLTPRFGDGILLCPDYDTIPALEDRRKIKRAAVLDLFDKGLISDVEAREELGYGPREENDVDKIDHNIIRVLLDAAQTLGLQPLIRYMKSVHLIDAETSEEEIVARALDLIAEPDGEDDDEGEGRNATDEGEEDEQEDAGNNVRRISA